MLLFCPHCDDIIEILGEPLPRPMPECEHCGAVLDVCDADHPASVERQFAAVFGPAPAKAGTPLAAGPPYDHLIGRPRKRARLRHEARISALGQER